MERRVTEKKVGDGRREEMGTERRNGEERKERRKKRGEGERREKHSGGRCKFSEPERGTSVLPM